MDDGIKALNVRIAAQETKLEDCAADLRRAHAAAGEPSDVPAHLLAFFVAADHMLRTLCTERQSLVIAREAAEAAERTAELARQADERTAELARQAAERTAELARQADERTAELARQADERTAELARQAAELARETALIQQRSVRKSYSSTIVSLLSFFSQPSQTSLTKKVSVKHTSRGVDSESLARLDADGQQQLDWSLNTTTGIRKRLRQPGQGPQ
ncbi:hypothetical protein BDR26DRAFT_403341 [Obelidium mucronatum]|nr:hypothetical protein BDR26DRAFT_403341 [Obelidium mucronatum]